MKNVPRPIRVIVIKKVYLRPIRSPSRKISAPNGRTAKPAAKASNVKINATFAGIELVKKYFARNAASVPDDRRKRRSCGAEGL
jgi:hypothetical protein